MATIVIATGDAALYSTLSAEIEGQGHAVEWATDGKDAHEAVLASQPALVFLDLTLTVFNGLETAAMLRGDPDVAAELPILLLTDDDLNPHEVEAAGLTALFPKAHGEYELRECLSQLVPS